MQRNISVVSRVNAAGILLLPAAWSAYGGTVSAGIRCPKTLTGGARRPLTGTDAMNLTVTNAAGSNAKLPAGYIHPVRESGAPA